MNKLIEKFEKETGDKAIRDVVFDCDKCGKNAVPTELWTDEYVEWLEKLASKEEEEEEEEEVSAHMQHIANVRNTCKRLGCTPTELLNKNYTKELGYD